MRQLSICFLGSDNAGKTLCIKKITNESVKNGNLYRDIPRTLPNPPKVSYKSETYKCIFDLYDNKGIGKDLSYVCDLNMPKDVYYLVFFSLDEDFQETFKKAK
jgi:hypothetical protein